MPSGTANTAALVTSVVSIVISVGVAAFAYLQWNDTHLGLLLSMRPSVDFYIGDDPDEPPVGITIRNSGPAPARIASITYFVDHKPLPSADDVISAGKFDPDKVRYVEFATDDTLGVGEHQALLEYAKSRKADAKEVERFADFIDDHVGIKVRFCSPVAPDDNSAQYCWERCSDKDKC